MKNSPAPAGGITRRKSPQPSQPPVCAWRKQDSIGAAPPSTHATRPCPASSTRGELQRQTRPGGDAQGVGDFDFSFGDGAHFSKHLYLRSSSDGFDSTGGGLVRSVAGPNPPTWSAKRFAGERGDQRSGRRGGLSAANLPVVFLYRPAGGHRLYGARGVFDGPLDEQSRPARQKFYPDAELLCLRHSRHHG